MTEHLLGMPYGPGHPLHLGAFDVPPQPAGAAVMLAATDLLHMADQGLPIGELLTESRVIARLAEAGGRWPDDVGTLLDVGALTSARRALGAWKHREGATGAVETVTGPVTGVTETVTGQDEEPDHEDADPYEQLGA